MIKSPGARRYFNDNMLTFIFGVCEVCYQRDVRIFVRCVLCAAIAGCGGLVVIKSVAVRESFQCDVRGLTVCGALERFLKGLSAYSRDSGSALPWIPHGAAYISGARNSKRIVIPVFICRASWPPFVPLCHCYVESKRDRIPCSERFPKTPKSTPRLPSDSLLILSSS